MSSSTSLPQTLGNSQIPNNGPFSSQTNSKKVFQPALQEEDEKRVAPASRVLYGLQATHCQHTGNLDPTGLPVCRSRLWNLSAPLLGTLGGALITPFPRVTLARHKFPIPHTQVIRWAQWMLAPQDCRVPSMARALQSFLPPSRQAMYFLSKYGLSIALNGH